MTIHSHIAELERKHRALDDELAEAMAHPSTDDFKIAELKRFYERPNLDKIKRNLLASFPFPKTAIA